MAGTPEKMVEYLLETRVDNTSSFDGKIKVINVYLDAFLILLLYIFWSLLWCVFLSFFFLVSDHFLNDFLVAFPIFMTTNTLCRELLSKYPFYEQYVTICKQPFDTMTAISLFNMAFHVNPKLTKKVSFVYFDLRWLLTVFNNFLFMN